MISESHGRRPGIRELILCFALCLSPFAGLCQQVSSHSDTPDQWQQLSINTSDIIRDTVGTPPAFPKYTSQLMNLANQNAQATRPKVIGQMSELIQQFEGNSYEQWAQWYTDSHPDAIDTATRKICGMINKLRASMDQIDENLVRQWVNDLVLAKTYAGLRFQKSVLCKIAESKNEPYRLSNPSEEAKGIDGYIGNLPVSVKPVSYRQKNMLNESINVHIIYYEKKKTGLTVYYDF
ncbi:MAG: MjaI family restriction endonuclease [Desulfobacterales bacterium]|nr:MjaI family restriction endonuclease [Desulfobacterales bacterium]MDD4071277.1 MjaI family restriction endonuclease [Desulfobacterales bacterium]MDD4393330.1 MjaI family restriction endonuclease [Desulfobacterales bacterium]